MSLRAVLILGALPHVGRGSRTAWWLFVAANSWALVMTLALAFGSSSAPGGQTEWPNAVVLSLGSAALLAILLSPPMRRRPALHG